MNAGVSRRTPTDVLLALRAGAFAIVVPLLVRTDLRRTLSAITPHHAGDAPPTEDLRRITRCVDAGLSRTRRLWASDCLTRGLTLWYFLREAGADATVVFGIGAVKDRMEGHCWVELDGRAWAERRDPYETFVETWRFPSAPIKALR